MNPKDLFAGLFRTTVLPATRSFPLSEVKELRNLVVSEIDAEIQRREREEGQQQLETPAA